MAITPADWLELNSTIHQMAESENAPNGIVITHGTATLEETAYFLNLTLKVAVPVVLVGAQRPWNGISSDAQLNLINAARTAASPKVRGLGVLTLLNDEIQAAREVTKSSNFRLEAFQSPSYGMLGSADPDGSIEIYRKPSRRHAPDTEFDVRGMRELPRVDIVYSYAGADGTAINAFVEAGSQAIIIASLPPGGVTPDEDRALFAARERGVLVIQGSRAGSGRVLIRERLRERGIVTADNLNPQKARVLAMLALTVTRDPEDLQRMFNEY
jgi:L-asparaginase